MARVFICLAKGMSSVEFIMVGMIAIIGLRQYIHIRIQMVVFMLITTEPPYFTHQKILVV